MELLLTKIERKLCLHGINWNIDYDTQLVHHNVCLEFLYAPAGLSHCVSTENMIYRD